MRHLRLPLALALALAAILCLLSSGTRADTVDCGGNAFTFAEVAPARPAGARSGPVTTRPQTLCADLVENRPVRIDSLSVQTYPNSGVGTGQNPAGPDQRVPDLRTPDPRATGGRRPREPR